MIVWLTFLGSYASDVQAMRVDGVHFVRSLSCWFVTTRGYGIPIAYRSEYVVVDGKSLCCCLWF